MTRCPAEWVALRALHQSERFAQAWTLLSGTYKPTVDTPDNVVLFPKRAHINLSVSDLHPRIDRSFLRDVLTNLRARTLYKAIVTMAKGLGLQVVAEGVENQDQLAFLREAQCDEAQGYLISKPVPGNDVPKLLISTCTVRPLARGALLY